MPRQISIQNFGPIINVSIDIKQFNIFIGPQSSGKSTIAKCISFGLWLEKDISLHQSADHIDKDFIRQQFLTYHKLESYVLPNSHIEYHCDFFTFIFTPSSSSVTLSKRPPMGMGKIAYIPSERNFVTQPNIATLKMGADYMRDFLFDWLLLRSKYTLSNAIPILDLGVKYYYDENRGDRIILNTGKDISLSEASSGLQSVTPLLASIIYCTRWVYENEADLSFDRHLLMKKALLKSLQEIEPSSKSDMLENAERTIVEILDEEDPSKPSPSIPLDDLLESYISRFSRPSYSGLIIEEPEQNLFPLTQHELVQFLASAFNSHSENVFVITTHSPYVMSSINNLIEAHHVVSRLGRSVWSNDISRETVLAHNHITAHYLNDGSSTDIFDQEVELISADALDSASNKIEQEFNRLLTL